MRKPKRSIHILIALLLAVSGILYALADRYLIQHVEIANVSAYAAAVTTTLQPPTASVNASTGSEGYPSSSIGETATGNSEEITEAQPAPVISDDWNYQSKDVSIQVSKVVTGSGSSQVAYFVAEVHLSDATQLENAFASNSFGRNIIDTTSSIAEQNNAVFAINGDYYGFRTDGIIIRNGVIYRDVPARTGLVFYRDGSMEIYDETETTAQALVDAGAWNTLSFGPALVEDSEVVDNSGTINIDNNFGNHPVSGNQPRTAIGMINPNHFVFVVVDGRASGYSRGVSLNELAQIFQDLGCTDAYNIDGGGSSTMYFLGRVVNNPLGRGQERSTSDILFVGS